MQFFIPAKIIKNFCELSDDEKLKTKEVLAEYLPLQTIIDGVYIHFRWTFWDAEKIGGYKVGGQSVVASTKVICDILRELGFFYDESQIVDISSSKTYGDIEGVHVFIKGVE